MPWLGMHLDMFEVSTIQFSVLFSNFWSASWSIHQASLAHFSKHSEFLPNCTRSELACRMQAPICMQESRIGSSTFLDLSRIGQSKINWGSTIRRNQGTTLTCWFLPFVTVDKTKGWWKRGTKLDQHMQDSYWKSNLLNLVMLSKVNVCPRHDIGCENVPTCSLRNQFYYYNNNKKISCIMILSYMILTLNDCYKKHWVSSQTI